MRTEEEVRKELSDKEKWYKGVCDRISVEEDAEFINTLIERKRSLQLSLMWIRWFLKE